MAIRRSFLKQSLAAVSALAVSPAFSNVDSLAEDIQISLAEWSFHRTIRAGKLDHLDFAAKAKKDYNISVVEYVNGLFGGTKMTFKEAARNSAYLNELLKRSQDAGVINHLLMIDEEGQLALPNDKERLTGVANHKKWFEAAQLLGCRTVRVNLHGEGAPDEKKTASIDSLGRLGEMAKGMNLNVVVENHGSESSKGYWVADVMRQVNLPNVGTLPDFGNFCITQPWGTTQGECSDAYDRYKGIEELLPYSKGGVSAKSYDFDANGEQPLIDYKRLLNIVKSSGFKGYIGIEYEGFNQPEEEGVKKTKALLEKYL
ncbi:MAG: TIM barrel protein [Cyclobacteriaceae bacterium]